MPYENWTASLESKVKGSWNLHHLLPADMDFFIMLSSIAGIVGSPAQSNYAAGNVYQDFLVRHRIGNGQKATSLDLGVMVDDGALVENVKLRKMYTATGCAMEVTSKELHALLDYYCDPNLPLTAPVDSQIIVGIEIPANVKASSADLPSWMCRPAFRYFHQMRGNVVDTSGSAENQVQPGKLLASAESIETAASIVANAVIQKLSKALAVPQESFDLGKPMHTYGVDSLFAVELRNWFSKEFQADMAVFDILGDNSFQALGVTVAWRSRLVSDELKQSSGS
jgi:hypothetical protein